jgi:hypothetical protein
MYKKKINKQIIELINKHTDFEVVFVLDFPASDFDFDLCLPPEQKEKNCSKTIFSYFE